MRKKTSFRKLVYPLLGAALCILALTSCGAVRALFLLVPNTNDYKRFPNREIHASRQVFQFASAQTDELGKKLFVQDRFVQHQVLLNDFVEQYHTEAFIIIVHDSIIYEKYPGQRAPEQPVTSFSITKSILSTLVGAAIQDGYIQSVHQSIVDFLPEWKGYEQVQIWDLMQHTSGISFNHSIANLFADEVQFYYGKNLRKRLKKRTVDLEPAKRFDYHSANTQLLALVLDAATQKNV